MSFLCSALRYERFEGSAMALGLFNKNAFRLLPLVLVVVGLGWSGISAASEPVAPADPATLHDAITEFAATYDITVTGADRLGQEAPDWPVSDQPPAAILRRLLSNYGYISELRPGAGENALPMRLTIVGASVERTAGGGDQAKNPMPASVRQMVAQRAAEASGAPSALTRSLTRLATGGHEGPGLAPSTVDKTPAQLSGLSGPTAPVATSPASSGTDMAALTQSARANVIGLVTSLQNACATSPNCR